MSFVPRENKRNSVLGNIRRLASFARENFYPRQLRGVSVLGRGLRRFDDIERGYGAGAETPSRSNGFGRFTSPNSGNIAQSSNTADAARMTATAGRMTSPAARDSDTIKRWRRV